MRTLSLVTAAALIAGLPMLANAGESPWVVKLGASYVKPKSGNADSELQKNAGAQLDISKETNLTPAIEYNLSDTLSTELLLALPFKHDVKAAGSKVAEFKHLPPTVTLKYRMAGKEGFLPYVGVGLNYTKTWGEKAVGGLAGNSLKASDSFGPAVQVGAEYRPAGSQWGCAVDLRYIKIKSDLKLNGAKVGALEVDPLVLGVSAVYHY